MPRTIRAIDLFCGAGGSSTGLREAVEAAGARLDLLAVNHWDVAIATHERNHPDQRHMCASIAALDPKKVVQGKVDLLWASPECTHHSVARGGKPINDQSRMSAWLVIDWSAALLPSVVLVENVKEFTTWGPIGSNGRPLKRRKGETFDAWLQALKSLGYTVDYRILNSADYGGATTRERLFVQARRGRSPIAWPERTHSRNAESAQVSMFDMGAVKRWRPAREIIDWSISGQSIFDRKKPLAKATLDRIAAGLRRFGGAKAEPFLLLLNRYKDRAYGVSEPVPTITATSSDFALVEPFPFLLGAGGTSGQQKPQSVDSPMGAILTNDRRAIVEPFIVPLRNHMPARSAGDPVPTITAGGTHIGVCEPFVVTVSHGESGGKRDRSIDEPLPTITGSPDHAIVEPFLVPFFGERDGQKPRTHSVDDPLPTVTGQGAGAVVEPYIVPLNHGAGDLRSHSMDVPMPTITTIDAWAMVEPMVVEYNGTGDTHPVSEPLPTVAGRDRFGLMECDGFRLDIRFRMLQPHELAAAMGFPKGYEFTGNREQKVKQIGNAVEKHVAKALAQAALGLSAVEEMVA